MSISLVIIIKKGQPMKLKLVGTVKGGDNDGQEPEVAEYLIPMFVHRGTVLLETVPAATYNVNSLSGEAKQELQVLKDQAIAGNVHRLGFDYTAPNIIDEFSVAQRLTAHGAGLEGEQALMYKFFTALFDWEGGRLDMLFHDEDNDSQVVSAVLAKIKDLCKA